MSQQPDWRRVLCGLAGEHRWEYDPDQTFDSILTVCSICGDVEDLGPREDG